MMMNTDIDDEEDDDEFYYLLSFALLQTIVNSERMDRDVLNDVISESMETYHEELLRKNENQNISSRDYQIVVFRQGEYRNDKCFICLEDFTEEESPLLQLDCKHIYHKSCIEEAVHYNSHCPLCRSDIKIHTMTTSTPPPSPSHKSTSR